MEPRAPEGFGQADPDAFAVGFRIAADHVFDPRQMVSRKLAAMQGEQRFLRVPLVGDVDRVVRRDRRESKKPLHAWRPSRGDLGEVARAAMILVAEARRVIAVERQHVFGLDLFEPAFDGPDRLIVHAKTAIRKA